MDDKTFKAMKDLHGIINSVELVMDATFDRSYDGDGYYTPYLDSYYALREVYSNLKNEYLRTYGHTWYNFYSMTEVIARIGGSHAKTVAR